MHKADLKNGKNLFSDSEAQIDRKKLRKSAYLHPGVLSRKCL
jgi:hypothetical protein